MPSSLPVRGLLLCALAAVACERRAIREPLPRFADSATEERDLVIVTLDTTRADHLGAYGYPRPTSPSLDDLAAEALVFERFIVPMATTLPVHFSLFTGLEPTEHGVLANKDFENRRFVPPDGARTLAAELRSQGWNTAGFVSAAPVKAHTGLDRGFAHYDQPRKAERSARETTDLALAWLEEQAQPPYLLWVHYFDPHAPLEPPRRHRRAMQTDDSLRSWGAERDLHGEMLEPVARYDGEILCMDEQLGRLVDSLRAAGRWDATVLVVAGDHGEGLGQHGIDHHGMTWIEQLHAPLLIRSPELEPGRHEGLVTASDLVPTVLNLLSPPDVRALVEQATGLDALGQVEPRRSVLSRTSLRRSERIGDAAILTPDTWALSTEEWTLHWTRKGPLALYHLPTDPFEQRSVLEDHEDLAKTLHVEGTLWLAAQRRLGRRMGAGKVETMDTEVVRQLEGLGYVD